MGRITFYEERNFGGRSYDCSSDCTDLTSYMSHCYSCRVHSGCFMVYDRANYMGSQYFLRRGEYPDCMSMGMSGFFRSCRMIPMYRGSYRMRIYERENFGVPIPFQLTFYEDRNFGGRSYDCSSD
ncbi:hypothetical protein Z043_122354, partial [Scleropages formosus]